MTIKEQELALVENILNGVNVSENMERLYLSLKPLFKREIARYGRSQDFDDLMQEMYFALVDSVEAYKEPETQANYAFHAIVNNKIRDKISAYLVKFYRKYIDDNGRQRAYRTHHNSVSLNTKVYDGDRSLAEIQDLLVSDDNVEEEIIARETAVEQAKAAAVLWAEVDKLSPLQREGIIDYYKHGISHVDKAAKTGKTRQNISGRVSKGLRKLRENPQVQEAAKAYIPSVAYRGGLRAFMRSGMSSTECAALQNIERESQKQGAKSTYKLIDSAFFDGKNIKALARCVGVAASSIRILQRGGGVWRCSAEKIANFYGIDFDKFFEIHTERAAPKGDPNRHYKVLKNIIKYTLVDSACLNGYNRTLLNREKIQKTGAKLDTVDKVIRRLKNGEMVTREIAERTAYVLGAEFGEMFKVAE